MKKKYILEPLTQDNVSVKIQQFVIENEKEFLVGEPYRRAYSNSVTGRQNLQLELPEPYLSAVLSMWGDTPTVMEKD